MRFLPNAIIGLIIFGVQILSAQTGTLYIIGGGVRPAYMVDDMINRAGVKEEGYILIFPEASSEPDTSWFYAKLQFLEAGIGADRIFCHRAGMPADSVIRARLLYLCGGDQNRFMESARFMGMAESIREAYARGALIAGTSAGAAVMSGIMITGNQRRSPSQADDAAFRTIEAQNIELAEGLGLLSQVVVDQHFIYRMRFNRLVSVALEHPGMPCLGIDESTALVVQGRRAEVVGESQVMVIRAKKQGQAGKNNRFSARKIQVHLLVEGDSWQLPRK